MYIDEIVLVGMQSCYTSVLKMLSPWSSVSFVSPCLFVSLVFSLRSKQAVPAAAHANTHADQQTHAAISFSVLERLPSLQCESQTTALSLSCLGDSFIMFARLLLHWFVCLLARTLLRFELCHSLLERFFVCLFVCSSAACNGRRRHCPRRH